MIAGYCWPNSSAGGEVVSLFASTDAEVFSVEVIRQGAADERVFRADFPGTVQERPVGAERTGCGWSPSGEIPVDPDWRSGFYLVRMSAGDRVAEAFFVVRAGDIRESALLVVSTSTWAAYNDWGGPSFYTGGHHSSQLRPLPKGFLAKPDPARHRTARFRDSLADMQEMFDGGYSRWSMAAGWANWELLFVRWAETRGLRFDYAVSQDLEREGFLDDYRAYISVGHDEYWSAGMRDTVESFVRGGGNAAFFSGNTAFWQVRFEEAGTQVVGYKLALEEDPVFGTDRESETSTMWSDPVVGRPENLMTGVSFTRGGYAHMPGSPRGTGGYSIWRPEHWAFEGLALHAGDIVGAEPVVVGYECDGCEMTLSEGRPVPTGTDGTPTTMEILGTAPAHLWETNEAPQISDIYVGELNWVAERLGGADTPQVRASFAYGAAVMGSFDSGEGQVFTTGCTDWAYGLGDEAVDTITMNILHRFGVASEA
ncbi:MAG: hypothetical protein CMQ24_20985 [Gammaproteobacteria bacterium]|nr:hypothetical protein [Gammaproteobacteria bacterium]